jgi:type IV pilus assembly protein PilE
MSGRRPAAFTVFEVLTALVVVGVLAAIAIPSWRTHLLRTRRADANSALIALQKSQDSFFASHARYADAAQLGVARSAHGWYTLELKVAADGLGYLASAQAALDSAQAPDERCARFTIDHLGQRRAFDVSGTDRSPDCWR